MSSTIPILHLTVRATRPTYLRMIGRHPNRRDVVYFDRKYGKSDGKGFLGQEIFDFPLPLLLGNGIQVSVLDAVTGDQRQVGIVREEIKRMRPLGLLADAPTKSFLNFAAKFAAECGAMQEGEYRSDPAPGGSRQNLGLPAGQAGGQFVIRLLDKIRRLDTGEVLTTPARVSHDTGVIYVSKEAFLPLTVVNRFFILCHEYHHVAGNTRNELDCDRFAINTCLRLGFAKTECLYSLTRLFLYEQDYLHPTSRKEREQRVQRAYDIITIFQEKHG